MIFRSLSMTGFKSFAEKTEMDIETGLTGIVGPNGCGKSNVVEALRWVMGESNARQMRGGEMDDVIFNGTDRRPARSLAEISLMLDNPEKRAPAEFNQHDELTVTRKIERGKGSQYQVNGRPARARDVQLLFADTATGARSAGIVSQGRIGAIVGAKPEDRRSLIEEAANIKGLHQRKHEAELRLKNTELNLERVQDLIDQLTEQRNQLARQAKQAARYASVADRIRKAEAQLLQAKWQHAETEHVAAQDALSEQNRQVADATGHTAQLAAIQAETAAKLPQLRQSEAEAAAEVQRLRLAVADYDKEAERVRLTIAQIDARLRQIDEDAAREASLSEDAGTALASLSAETDALRADIDQTAPEHTQAQQALQQLTNASLEADRLSAELGARFRNAESTKTQLETQIGQLNQRIQDAETTLDEINLDQLADEIDTARALLDDATQTAQNADTALTAAIDAQQTANDEKDSQREALNNAESQVMRLTAEIDALAYILSESQPDEATPAADSLRVDDGYEAALSACLSADILLPFDAGTNGFWRQDLSADTQLSAPQTGTPLASFISGNDLLCRAISGVSVTESDEDALAAQHQLTAGQALVTPQGHLYRWDGLVRKHTASAEAERIRQKHRLAELSAEAEIARQTEEQLRAAFDAAAGTAAATAEDARTRQANSKQAEQILAERRRAHEKAVFAHESAERRHQDILSLSASARDDLQQAQASIAEIGDIATLEIEAEQAMGSAAEQKQKLTDALQTEAALAQKIQSANTRLLAIDAQRADWQTRQAQTDSRKAQLAERKAQARAEAEELTERPQQIEDEKLKTQELREQAETRHQAQSDNLRHAENTLLEQDRASKDAERELAACREQLIRCEARQERVDTQMAHLQQQIAEKLSCTPDQLADIAGQPKQDMPSLEKLEMTVQRLLREREQIGPVNLRAEVEMAELDQRMTELQGECDDLHEAISKLRTAISSLNREGRMRLLDSFAEVNGHFTSLFTTLFGGGHAELRLTESDDPLQAGLEIMASPPGKKMQSLSLLSGGEQALTALAIIFAVFLTNPAPICILDEVDAPLDDTNVERFCDLLRQISRQTNTRFLVVTHHRMTMARMDRLFGVTMEQQGISRIVSVDLQTAEDMQDQLYA